MSKEPWKRAYTLSRLKQAGANNAAGGGSRLARRRFPWAALLLSVLAVALGGGGWYLWTQRGVLIPRYAPQLPAPVKQLADKTPLPQVQVSSSELDSGLGIGLTIGGSYLTLVSDTNPWKINWAVTVLGADHLKLTAPGVKAYADNGKLSTYELDVKQIEASKAWAPWLPELRKAGVSSELNWRTATGASELPHGASEHNVTGQGGQNFGGEPAKTIYTLQFVDGWLAKVEGGMSTIELRTPTPPTPTLTPAPAPAPGPKSPATPAPPPVAPPVPSVPSAPGTPTPGPTPIAPPSTGK